MNTWSPRLSLRRPRRVPGFLLAVGIAVIFFIGKTARAEIVEVSITGHWTKKDFKVTDNKNEIYDPANPKFDGKVFGIAPSAGSVTVKLIVNTDGHIFYAKGSRPKVNSSDVNTLAHDFFGYTNVALVDDTFHFGSAVWRSDGNLTGLVGPNEAKMGLWTDADITKAPQRGCVSECLERLKDLWRIYSSVHPIRHLSGCNFFCGSTIGVKKFDLTNLR